MFWIGEALPQKAPLCKGSWRGLKPRLRGCRRNSFLKALAKTPGATIPQSAARTAPFTQGGLLAFSLYEAHPTVHNSRAAFGQEALPRAPLLTGLPPPQKAQSPPANLLIPPNHSPSPKMHKRRRKGGGQLMRGKRKRAAILDKRRAKLLPLQPQPHPSLHKGALRVSVPSISRQGWAFLFSPGGFVPRPCKAAANRIK